MRKILTNKTKGKRKNEESNDGACPNCKYGCVCIC